MAIAEQAQCHQGHSRKEPLGAESAVRVAVLSASYNVNDSAGSVQVDAINQ